MNTKKNKKISSSDNKDDVLKDIYDLLTEAREVKSGEFRSSRLIFEERTTNKLNTIEKMLEGYTNIIQKSVWFFKLMNWFANNKKYIMFLIFGFIIIVNLIQYIPLPYLTKIFLSWLGINI